MDGFDRMVEVIAICEMLLGSGGLLDAAGCVNSGCRHFVCLWCLRRVIGFAVQEVL